MKQRNLKREVVVVADDFTGANDAGVSLALGGKKVGVAFHLPFTDEVDVLVLNSDSRALCPADARIKMAQFASQVADATWLVKKIDSTMRGNVGIEIDALLTLSGKRQAVICPAFPAAGRTTRHGQCLVRGVPLMQTEFASDPKTPVLSDDIAEIIRTQTSRECRSIIPAELQDQLAGDASLLIVDAQTDSDLDQIIEAVIASGTQPLLVGSAGLCDALSRRLAPAKRQRLLAVVGSMSEVAQQQLRKAVSHPRVVSIFIDVDDVFSHTPEHYVERIAAALRQGDHCIVHTCPDDQSRHQIADLCRQRGLSRAELGEKICSFLGVLTRQALEREPADALYVSGGDVAMAVASALDAQGFQITGQVAACVPVGRFMGCGWQRPVMTKAGGFGDETTLLQILNVIEERVRD